MTLRQEILTRLVAARITQSGVFPDMTSFVRDLRPAVREIMGQDESPVAVSQDKPEASTVAPWSGFAYAGGQWREAWFDGATWRRNNLSGADITPAVTHWRNLSQP